jgi:hypothetical protein
MTTAIIILVILVLFLLFFQKNSKNREIEGVQKINNIVNTVNQNYFNNTGIITIPNSSVIILHIITGKRESKSKLMKALHFEINPDDTLSIIYQWNFIESKDFQIYYKQLFDLKNLTKRSSEIIGNEICRQLTECMYPYK